MFSSWQRRVQEPEGGWARSGHPEARAGRGAGSTRARPGSWGMGTEPGGGSAARRPDSRQSSVPSVVIKG